MRANIRGYHECARLVREYLENNDDTDGTRNDETRLGNLTLTEVANRIEEMNANEALLQAKMKDDQKEELKKFETEQKRKRDEILVKHEVENKKFRFEFEKTKKALRQELKKA